MTELNTATVVVYLQNLDAQDVSSLSNAVLVNKLVKGVQKPKDTGKYLTGFLEAFGCLTPIRVTQSSFPLQEKAFFICLTDKSICI